MTALEDVNDIETTAAYLKITKTALVAMARQNKIGSLKQGRVYTFPRAEVEAYVGAHTTHATAPNPHGLTTASLRRVRSATP